MQSTRTPTLPPWLVVSALLAAATGAGFALDHHVSLTSQAMFYVLAVVLASYALGWLPSVICAVAAVTALNFFFVPPRWTFAVDSQEHLIALFTMLLVALVISHLSAGLRRETSTAQRNESRARQLQQLATDLSAATDAAGMLALTQSALDAAFAGPNAVALTEAINAADAACRDGMQACLREAAVLGPGTGRWPGLDAWYLPLGSADSIAAHADRRVGAACVQPALAADHAGREHAQALCTLTGQALLRLQMTQALQATRIEAQRQQVQSTFLAAISHDLRTPLAAVVGAASSLQSQRDKLSVAEQDQLLQSMVREAQYLSTLTENTLQLVQLSNAQAPAQRGWESMEEIVGSVLARVRQIDTQRRIRVRLAPDLPLIQGDPVLLAQLLSNLLDNALKYSDADIELAVDTSGEAPAQRMRISVKDRGPGVAPDAVDAIFEPYARNDHSGQRGAGLGLALCRAIAQLHDGTLTVSPRKGGGARFTLSLPLVAQPHVAEQELP